MIIKSAMDLDDATSANAFISRRNRAQSTLPLGWTNRQHPAGLSWSQ
jgi:hypothetical protein